MSYAINSVRQNKDTPPYGMSLLAPRPPWLAHGRPRAPGGLQVVMATARAVDFLSPDMRYFCSQCVLTVPRQLVYSSVRSVQYR